MRYAIDRRNRQMQCMSFRTAQGNLIDRPLKCLSSSNSPFPNRWLAWASNVALGADDYILLEAYGIRGQIDHLHVPGSKTP